MRKLSDRQKGFVMILSVAIAIFVGFAYSHREDLNLSVLSGITEKGRFRGKVKCSVTSDVGEGHHLSMKLAIPCKNRKQQVKLMKKLPRLKHEFMMSLSQPEIGKMARERDFSALRRELVSTVQQHADPSVKTVYFEGFYMD